MPVGVAGVRWHCPGKEERDFLFCPGKPLFPSTAMTAKGSTGAPAQMSAASAGAGEKPKIGHRRICVEGIAVRKYLCPGKAGFEWVWGFFIFKDVIKITWNPQAGTVTGALALGFILRGEGEPG